MQSHPAHDLRLPEARPSKWARPSATIWRERRHRTPAVEDENRFSSKKIPVIESAGGSVTTVAPRRLSTMRHQEVRAGTHVDTQPG
jgi:hypothetical protein